MKRSRNRLRHAARSAARLAVSVGMAAAAILAGACGPAEDPSSAPDAPEEDISGAWEEKQRAMERLANLGYLEGGSRTAQTGVTRHDPAAAEAGLTFYMGAQAPEANLIDMDGRVVHRWSCTFDRAFPDADEPPPTILSTAWRRAKLLPDGCVLAIFEGFGMAKLDRDSDVLWALVNRGHHDLDFDPAGNLYTLCREFQYEPRFPRMSPVMLDYVRIFSPEGQWMNSISIDQAYKDSGRPVTRRPGNPPRDIYHTNTLQWLDGRFADRHPAFREGNLLLSFRCLNEIAILDPDARRLVWFQQGPWKQQHEPSVLDNGNFLIFDNQGGDKRLGGSRVIEFDPLTLEIAWMYEGTEEDKLYTRLSGSTARLANGNTLITVTEQSRIIEVTPDKRVVWEFVNPAPSPKGDGAQAAIFEGVRVDYEFVADWLDAEGPPA